MGQMAPSPTSRRAAPSADPTVATSRMKTSLVTPTHQAHCPWQTLANQTAVVRNSSSMLPTIVTLIGSPLGHPNTPSLAKSQMMGFEGSSGARRRVHLRAQWVFFVDRNKEL